MGSSWTNRCLSANHTNTVNNQFKGLLLVHRHDEEEGRKGTWKSINPTLISARGQVPTQEKDSKSEISYTKQATG